MRSRGWLRVISKSRKLNIGYGLWSDEDVVDFGPARTLIPSVLFVSWPGTRCLLGKLR